MNVLRQLILGVLVIMGTLYVWISYLPAAAPMLARIGVYDVLGIDPPALDAGGGGAGFAQGRPTQVVTADVTERAMADRITAIGDGRVLHAVTVRSRVAGVLTDLTLDAGSRVEAGRIIARLENETETIALEQARILLADAADEAERIGRLENTGAVTETRLRETRLALRNAELALRQAEFDLSQREVVAPVSGWIGIIDVAVGDRVDAQDALATITDRSEILIDFRVPERVVPKLEIGQTIEVTPLGLRDTVLKGEISAIDTVVDRASRTLRVQGRVANDDDRLRAGMAFSVGMSFPGETLLSIPALALQWSSEGPFVWVVREGSAKQVSVVLRQRDSDTVLVIADDLQAGDAVVTEGVQTLRNGTEVVPAQETGAAVVGPSKGEAQRRG